MKNGYTLIELMVVIVILGIIASLAIPKYLNATDYAKMAEWRTFTKQIVMLQTGYSMYHDNYASPGVPAGLSVSKISGAQRGECPSEDLEIAKLLGFGSVGDNSRFNYWTTGEYDGLSSVNTAIKIGKYPINSSAKMNGNYDATGQLILFE